jgi:hypothetical protein
MNPTKGYGTYVFGLVRNIKCANSTSATLNSSMATVPNSCQIGVTINNPTENLNNISMTSTPSFRQQLMQSNASLPDLATLLNESRLGINASSSSPESLTSSLLSGNCENMGTIFNPTGNLTIGSLPGFLGQKKIKYYLKLFSIL